MRTEEKTGKVKMNVKGKVNIISVWLRTGSNPADRNRFRSHTGKTKNRQRKTKLNMVLCTCKFCTVKKLTSSDEQFYN